MVRINRSISTEDKYRERFRELQGWYRSHYTETRVQSSAGTTLRVAVPLDRSGGAAAIVVSGRTEFIEKYLEFARDLFQRGISAVLYDHCGQGGSDRLLDDPQKGYIDSFETYVADLGRVVDTVCDGERESVHLIGHSMGGTVATLFALRDSERVIKMVLGSPMCAIRTGSKVPQAVIRPLAALGCLVGFGQRYMPTKGPYQPDVPFIDNLFTSDETRFEFNRFLTNSLEFAPLGGPTFRWLHEAYKAMAAMNRSADRIGCPHLILAAPQDRVIKTPLVREFCHRSENCSLREYEDAHHELFMEVDTVRNDILSQIADFFGEDS